MTVPMPGVTPTQDQGTGASSRTSPELLDTSPATKLRLVSDKRVCILSFRQCNGQIISALITILLDSDNCHLNFAGLMYRSELKCIVQCSYLNLLNDRNHLKTSDVHVVQK